MSRRTVVTGGAGFVGRALVARLRAGGEMVCSYDLAAPSHPDDVQGSVLDPAALRDPIAGASSVFHLAGNAQLWARDGAIFDKVNRAGTECVIDAVRAAGGAARLVHCSSLTTLVSRAAPIGASFADETTVLNESETLGAYPASKWRAEKAVSEACGDIDAVIAIPTEPLGPGDDSLTPPTRMILDFANGRTPAYIDCILNFVPVDSLADGLIAARDRGRRGERYLLGGENTPLAELLKLIEARSGRPAPKTKMPYWVALTAGAVDTGLFAALTGRPPKAPLAGVRLAGRQVSFSSHKAERDLGWRAGPLAPALDALFEWARTKGLLT